ncbi:hypothetical protein ABZP36_011441 [Zizania latifolia]
MGNILKWFLRCLDGEDDDGGRGDHYAGSYRPDYCRVVHTTHFPPQSFAQLKAPLIPPPPPADSSCHGHSRNAAVTIAAVKLDLPNLEPKSTRAIHHPIPIAQCEGPLVDVAKPRCKVGPTTAKPPSRTLRSQSDGFERETVLCSQGGRLQPPYQMYGVAALERDLHIFTATSMVPEGLAQHVSSSKKARVEWYTKILDAYMDKKSPPRTSTEASMLIATALRNIQRTNLQGVLVFYGFPIPTEGSEYHPSSSIPEGVLFVLNTLPVNARWIVDGDGFTCYVDAANPIKLREGFSSRGHSPNSREQKRADDLQMSLQNTEHKDMIFSGREIFARKYDIRLRGIDAPEMKMKYGKESQRALVKLIAWKCVTLHVYGQDQFKRFVCDIYCGSVFIQEQMLLNGHVWHFKIYDKRPEFEMWEKEAQAARRGLWASDNPEKPWEWRKKKRKADGSKKKRMVN